MSLRPTASPTRNQKPVKHNVQTGEAAPANAKPLPSILADIQKAADVTALAAIRDYVAARQYSEVDVGEIKNALKSRHETLTQHH